MKKHTDPSDVTVNLCLERSSNLKGSQVQFFGTKELKSAVKLDDEAGNSDEQAIIEELAAKKNGAAPVSFLVMPESGWATIHWGQHPHLVTSLEAGQRTNVVLTYCFVDKAKSTAMKSDCFQDESLKN